MPRGSKPGERRGGRKKGTPNKVTSSARAAVAEAFENLGGVDFFVKWARAHPTEFFTKVYTKLIPIEHTGKDGAAITVVVAPEEAEL